MTGMEYVHHRENLSEFGKKLLDSHEVQEGLKTLKQVVHQADLSMYVVNYCSTLFLIGCYNISISFLQTNRESKIALKAAEIKLSIEDKSKGRAPEHISKDIADLIKSIKELPKQRFVFWIGLLNHFLLLFRYLFAHSVWMLWLK